MQSIEGIDEHDLYPVHESSTPPPSPDKYRQVHYLTGALQAHLGGGRIMSGSCLHYLEEGRCVCVTPDIAAASAPPLEPSIQGYTSWEDPPLLFAAEIEEDYPLTQSAGEGVPTFAELLELPEYLYVDPATRGLWLWRRTGGRHQRVLGDGQGRVWSEALRVSFGFDESGFLRVYAASGGMLLTHREQVQQTMAEAQRRADVERRVAELTTELERLRRSGAPPE